MCVLLLSGSKHGDSRFRFYYNDLRIDKKQTNNQVNPTWIFLVRKTFDAFEEPHLTTAICTFVCAHARALFVPPQVIV